MCGVLGLIHDNRMKISSDFFLSILSSLDRRGPDRRDFIDLSLDNFSLKLGHTRLSIIDLKETGNQPMESHSGRFTIIYNGEIYNHKELRKKIETTGGLKWRGTSDTETLLAMFENYDVEEVLSSIEGMFAFCLFDRLKNRIILARDRSGEKPLYISSSKEFFGFSSDLSPLKKLPTFKKSLDFEAVGKFLKFNYIPCPYSIYKNSFKLPPASLINIDLNKFKIREFNSFTDLISSNGVTIKKWWDLDSSYEKFDASDFSDKDSILSRTEDLLSKSIGNQMISDVPLGAFLSGGIDSSLIVSLMQRNFNKNKTFTVGFDFLNFDESRFAEKIATHLGTDHTTYICKEKDFFELIPNISAAFSEPFADSSQLPTMLVSRMARNEVKVALSGDAGDELFGGYNRYLLANKYWTYMNLLPNSFRLAMVEFLRKIPRKSLIHLFRFIPLIPLSGSQEGRMDKILDKLRFVSDEASFYESLTTEWLDSDNIIDMELKKEDILKNINSSGLKIEEAMMKADFLSYLPDDILCKVDRSSMFYSLETRAPFLNKDLIEYSFSIPLKYKIRNGEGKWILKEILSKYLPEELFNRPKQGFGIPVSKWMRNELKDWVNDMLSEDVLNSHNLFNKSVVNRIKKEHFKGEANHEHKLWSLIQFNQWHESNKNL